MNEDDMLFVAGGSEVATMLFKQVNRLLHHAGRIVVFNNFRISQPVGQAFHQGIVADLFTCQKMRVAASATASLTSEKKISSLGKRGLMTMSCLQRG